MKRKGLEPLTLYNGYTALPTELTPLGWDYMFNGFMFHNHFKCVGLPQF